MDRQDKIALGVLVAMPIGIYVSSRFSQKGGQDNGGMYANATGLAVAPTTDPLGSLVGKLQNLIGKSTATQSSGTTTTSGGGASGSNAGKTVAGIAGLKNKADRFQGVNTGKNGGAAADPGTDELAQLQQELNDLMNFKPVKPVAPQPTTGGYYDPSMYAQPAPQSSGMGIDFSSLDWKMILLYGGAGVVGIYVIRKIITNMKAKKVGNGH